MRIEKNTVLASLILILFSHAAFAQSPARFDSGMQVFNKANYGQAIKEFQAALEENPDSVESRFYYALSLYYDYRLDESRAEFSKVAEKYKDSPWGRSALSFIQAIDLGFYAPAPEKDLSGYLNISYDTDDNIAYNQIQVAEGEDTRTSGMLSLSYKPTIFSYKPISISCNSYGTMYYKNTDNNEYGGGGDASLYLPLLWGTFFSVSGGSVSDYLKYDPYYTSGYDEGRLTFNLFGENLAWTSIYGGSTNIYYASSAYEGYDSHDSRIGIRQNLNALIYLECQHKYSDTRSDNYAYMSDEYSIGATAPFILYSKFFVLVKYMNKLFLNDDPVGHDQRHDTSYSFDINVTKNIFKYLTLGLRYNYTMYESNLRKDQSVLGYGSYNDHILSLSISYVF